MYLAFLYSNGYSVRHLSLNHKKKEREREYCHAEVSHWLNNNDSGLHTTILSLPKSKE